MDVQFLFQHSLLLPSEKKITCNIYDLGGKLIITSEKFIGFNPFVTPLEYPATEHGKKTVNQQGFSFQDNSFNINLYSYSGHGKLRFSTGIEIMKGDLKIVDYEENGGFYFYYKKGNTCYMENKTAYFIMQNQLLSTYSATDEINFRNACLLILNSIEVPERHASSAINPDASSIISIKEGEDKRIVDWQGSIHSAGTSIIVKHSSIHGYKQFYSMREREILYKREDGRHHVKEEIIILEPVD